MGMRMMVFSWLLAVLPCQVLPCQSVLTVGIDPAEPWKIVGEQDRVTGAEVELFKALGQKLHADVVLKPLPFKRCIAYMESGEIDMMSGLLKTPEREAFVHFLPPPYKTRSNKAFYVLRASGITVAKYDDLKGLKIGVKSGVRFFPQFDADETLAKVEGQNFDQLILMLMLIGRRFEVLAMTDSVGDYWIRQIDRKGLVAKAPFGFYQENDVYLGLSKKSPFAPRSEEISRILAAMIQSGELDRIFSAFFRREKIPLPVYR